MSAGVDPERQQVLDEHDDVVERASPCRAAAASASSSSNSRAPSSRSPRAAASDDVEAQVVLALARRARRRRSSSRPRRRRPSAPPRGRSRPAPTTSTLRSAPHHCEPSAATRRSSRQVAGAVRGLELPRQRRRRAELVEPDAGADLLHLGAQRGGLGRVRRHELEAVVDRPRQQHGVAGPAGRRRAPRAASRATRSRDCSSTHGAGPLDERPRLGERVADGPGVGERPVGPVDGLGGAAADHVQLGQRPRGDAAQPPVVERRPQRPRARRAGPATRARRRARGAGGRRSAGRRSGRAARRPPSPSASPSSSASATKSSRHAASVATASSSGSFGRLGQPLGGEAQGRERQPLLEVPRRAAPGDRRDLVVPVGALGVVRERGVVEHRRPAHGLEAALVQPAPLAAEQLVDDGVGDEGVGEPELVVADLDDDAGVDERAQGVDADRPRRPRSRRAAPRTTPPGRTRRAPRRRCRRPCSSPSSCWRTASSSDHGSSASSRSDTIARGPTTRISSSTTNGMPALRRCSASMNADDGWPPDASEIAATIAPTSVRSRRSRRTCSTEWRRSRRSTSSPPGWPRDRSFGPVGGDRSTRFGHGCWAMRSIRLALAVSIQWRSSTTSTAGPRGDGRRRRGRTRRRRRRRR